MALILENLDGLEPAEAACFVKNGDGKYEFKPEDTTGLKSALVKEREASKAGKAWQALGKTPDEITALLQEKEDRDQADRIKRGEFDKDLAARDAKFNEEREGFKKSLSKRDRELERRAIIADATQVYLKAGAKPENVGQLVKLTREHFKLEETDDGFDVRVVGPDGRPRIADANGTPMGIEHVAAEIKANVAEYGMFFLGSGASGGGSGPSGNVSQKTMSTDEFNALAPAARTAFMKAGGALT